MISYCKKCHSKIIGIENKCECGGAFEVLGPLWTGKIQDRDFCKRMLAKFDFQNRKELMLCSEEIDQPFYYDLHLLSKSLKKGPPKIDKVIETLRKNGFRASRTHLCLTGVKTNAGIIEVKKFI